MNEFNENEPEFNLNSPIGDFLNRMDNFEDAYITSFLSFGTFDL